VKIERIDVLTRKSFRNVEIKGAFTLARFCTQFCTELAHLEMNFFIYFAKRASLKQNRMQKLLM
jgi:hypothetical protein